MNPWRIEEATMMSSGCHRVNNGEALRALLRDQETRNGRTLVFDCAALRERLW
jgi:hypothetical protein